MRRPNSFLLVPAQTFENGRVSIPVLCTCDDKNLQDGNTIVADSDGNLFEVPGLRCDKCGSVWIDWEPMMRIIRKANQNKLRLENAHDFTLDEFYSWLKKQGADEGNGTETPDPPADDPGGTPHGLTS